VISNRVMSSYLNRKGGTDAATMVSVLSGKGGVGKSIIAFNLAERLAATGQRTLLVDTDIACGSIHILANKARKVGCAEFAAQQVTLSNAIVPYSDTMAILPMSPQGTDGTGLTAAAAAMLAANLRQQGVDYDFIIVDQSSGVSEAAAVLAAASDINLLVVVPELTSISDAYGLSKFLRARYRALDCRLLLNRCESDQEIEYLRVRFSAVVEQFQNWTPQFAGALPEDPAVRRSLAAQNALAEVAPESPVVQSLTLLAQNLAADIRPVVATRSMHLINNNPAPADIRG
jgi:flagellar biosynthesis protein FlhG